MRLTMRIIAMIIGLMGSVVAFILNILYSLSHVLGFTDSSHFFIGILLVVLAVIGSFTAIANGLAGAVLMVLALIGFFLIFHWWALLIAPFLLVAAVLAYADSTRARAALG